MLYIYGLVRKEYSFPYTILKIISSQKKNFIKYFMHINILNVDNDPHFFSILP